MLKTCSREEYNLAPLSEESIGKEVPVALQD